MLDPRTQLLCTLLAPLAEGSSVDWASARAAPEASGEAEREPPDSYGPDVWAELVRVGRLIDVGHGVLELPPD